MPFDGSRYNPQVWGKPTPGTSGGNNANLFDQPGTSAATATRHYQRNPEPESMDPNSSYDQMAGGWGDEEENYMEGGPSLKGRPSTGAPVMQERTTMFDKIHLPVTISNLCQIEEDRDKYKIGDYSFGTIRTVARVMRVTELPDTITYQCCDTCEAEPDKTGVEDWFPIIRYFGVDDTMKREVLDVGTVVLAFGKLRTFSSKASIVSFHVIKLDAPEQEIAIFQKEAELAALYYAKKFPELQAQQLINSGVSMFSPLAPERKPFNAGEFAAQRGIGGNTGAIRTPSRTTPSAKGARGLQQPKTPVSANRAAAGPGRPMFNTQSASKKVAGLNAQQQKIYECIRECANSSEGVSLDQIKKSCRISGDCLTDLNHLFAEGLIFNTVDDYHYASV